MSPNDGPIHKRDHLTVHAVIPVWERCAIYPGAGVIPHETDHFTSKVPVRQSCCRPDLPVYRKKEKKRISMDWTWESAVWGCNTDTDQSLRLKICSGGIIRLGMQRAYDRE